MVILEGIECQKYMVILEGIECQKRFRTTLHHVYPAWISILPGVKDIVAKDKWKYNAGSQMDRPNAHVFNPSRKVPVPLLASGTSIRLLHALQSRTENEPDQYVQILKR